MKRILLSCLLYSTVSPTWAGFAATETSNFHMKFRPYIGGGAGGMQPVVNKSHEVWAGEGMTPDIYNADKGISDQGIVFVDAGYTWVTENQYVPYFSAGLRYMYVTSFDVKGYVDKNSLPNNKSYFYKYSVNQQNILARLKMDFSGWELFKPYLTFSFGTSVNKASDYEERPVGTTPARISPGFSTYTNNNWAYIWGAGMDVIYSKNIWFNVEYEYGDFGKVSTGYGNNSTSIGGLNYSTTTIFNKVTGHILLAGLTYYLW